MILSTWNFEYALALSTKTISFHYVRHPMSFTHVFCLSKIHFHQSDRAVKIDENNAEIFSLLC